MAFHWKRKGEEQKERGGKAASVPWEGDGDEEETFSCLFEEKGEKWGEVLVFVVGLVREGEKLVGLGWLLACV